MDKIFHKIYLRLKRFVEIDLLCLFSEELKQAAPQNSQKSHEHIVWVNRNLVDLTDCFVRENKLNGSVFINKMNRIFQTSRFELLLKKWIADYFFQLFNILYDYCQVEQSLGKKLTLRDNPVNRFGVEKYFSKFGLKVEVIWLQKINLMGKIFFVFLYCVYALFIALKSGVKILGRRKKYKVMREALWGLYDIGGYFFHDDFMVDGVKIKKNEILLFSRITMKWCEIRLKAYHDARNSSYTHFFLPALKIKLSSLFLRILPKYILRGSGALLSEAGSSNFTLFANIYWYFVIYALPYEKIFSNFRVVSELGHNYFAANHIPEAIVCQGHGVKYYLMHWSDISNNSMEYIFSFLGCDQFLSWGSAHSRAIANNGSQVKPVGFIFKRFIREISLNRIKVLAEMGIEAKGKVVSFFDESFGKECIMTEENFVAFWQVALDFAQGHFEHTVIIKPKNMAKFLDLSPVLKERLTGIRGEMQAMSNLFIIDSRKWSFIEVIGVSDVVITQGMTSSATIALICGVDALYFDQANCKHPFSELFKNKIVFDEEDKFLNMLNSLIRGEDSSFNMIPEKLIREYDEYSDDCAIDRVRSLLTGEAASL